MGTQSKKGEVSKKSGGKKEKLKSKDYPKDNNSSKSKKKGKDTETKTKSSYDKKKPKSRGKSIEKDRSRRGSLSNEESKKKNVKEQKKKKSQKEAEPKNTTNNGGGTCFLCCCCAGNENEELNEILFQQEQRAEEAKKRREEEARKRQEEERMKREAEEERMRRQEEERIRQTEEERIRREEEQKLKREMSESSKQQKLEEAKDILPEKKTVLKKAEPKQRPPLKKAQLVFTGYAAAPPPPPASECAGSLPNVRPVSISLSQGAYLVYKLENGGQLEIKYSKTALNEKGVLAYIAIENIPAFYFNKNDGTEVLLKDVKRLLTSEYVNDRILYYEKWNEFIKLKKNLDGTLYLLPAFEVSPPARIDIMFLISQQRKIQYAPIEKPVEMVGDYMIIIQHGLEIFKKEIHVDAIVSYVNSFGVLTYI